MLRTVLAAGIIVIVTLLVREALDRRAGKRLLTRKHFVLRVASGLVLIAVLVMMLVGDAWLRTYSPLFTIAYWTLCFILASLLVVLALLDLKQVGISYGEDRKRMIRDLAKSSNEDGNGR